MKDLSQEPYSPFLEPDLLVPAPGEMRHDGWTAATQVAFLETLADTGIVSEACRLAQMSTSAAYAYRRRSAGFAACWEQALAQAREKLADTLLARSFEGQTEYYYQNGELVGERKTLDGRLGLAILKRLDRQAEERARAARLAAAGDAPLPQPDLDAAFAALAARDDEGVAKALALLSAQSSVPEVDEVDDPPVHPLDGSDFTFDDDAECWWTHLAPASGFTGRQDGVFGEEGYRRTLDAEEQALVAAVVDREREVAEAQAQARRAAVMARLRALAAEPPAEEATD